MILDVFTDALLQKEIETNELNEDTKYYLKITPHSAAAIELEVTSGFCSNYIDWVPSNEIGQIYFHNVIGMVDIFGYKFNVKSKKFLATQNGEDQLQSIINDIAEIASEFIFSPVSAPGVSYSTDTLELTNNPYFMYKYLTSNLFKENGMIFQRNMDLIIANPTYVQRSISKNVDIFSATKYNVATFRKMVQGSPDSMLIPSSHSLMKSRFIQALPKTLKGDCILPKKIYSSVNQISYDTQENRFILYFLKWCISVFRSVEQYYEKYQITRNCENSIKLIQRYIQRPLFHSVGVLSNISYASSALINRSGYKEFFHHYLRCREKPTLFINEFTQNVLMMEIKDISVIYEYWVFFKTAKQIFDDRAVLKAFKLHTAKGDFKYGLILSDNEKKLFYNKTYSHSSGQSYSFSFRPDISLEVVQEGIINKYFFDAKYSSTSIPSENDESQFTYKNINVFKMLSYLESISCSEAAVIIYPGTKFIFYEKRFADVENGECINNVVDSYAGIQNFRGVGAVPLSPGNQESDIVFSKFMKIFLRQVIHSKINN